MNPEKIGSSSGFFSIAAEICDKVTKYGAFALITLRFSKSKSEFKFLQLMTSFQKTRTFRDL